MSEEGEPDFEQLVRDALDELPDDIRGLMTNVAVTVEDMSPQGPNLLGLYEGVPLTARDHWYAGVLPDRITVFRGPILRRARTHAEIVEEVRVTVVHEVAHHFGISDARLAELGWA